MPYRPRSTDVWFNLPGVVAAYQQIAAPDSLAARQNVAHDARRTGVYTTITSTPPNWSSLAGCRFIGANEQYLDTQLVMAAGMSWLVRFANTTSQNLCGVDQGANLSFYLQPHRTYSVYYANGGQQIVGAETNLGVLGCAGPRAYRNGVDMGVTMTSVVGTPSLSFTFGRINNLTPYTATSHTGDVLAAVFARRIFSASDMYQISRQMAYCHVNPDWSAWGRRRRYYYAPAALAAMRRRQADAVRIGSRGVLE